MINKIVSSVETAIAGIPSGATILVSGFGEAGSPVELLHALVDLGPTDLTIISNNTGSGQVGLAALIANHQVRKVICSFPKTSNSVVFPELYRSGKIELELVPQGTLAERIRCGGAGIPAFYTPASVGTPLEEGKETRTFDGRKYVLEYAIRADYALVKCRKADRYGNLVYNKTARNFGPVMCTAASGTIVQASEIVEAGSLDPESIVTPGIFVSRVVEVRNPLDESVLVAENKSYPWKK